MVTKQGNAALELSTLHIQPDNLPYVELEPGLEYRLLQVRPSEGLTVTQVRAQPGASSTLHQHAAPVFGFTVSGAWGHDYRHEYRPGSYIYETPGVPHRFLNGPQVSEVVFISLGDVEHLDPTSLRVTKRLTASDIHETFLAFCTAQGIVPEILP